MFALLVSAALAAGPGPAFIENDHPRAVARAKQEKKLLFVDAWAPWCHSCLYLREHVLNQPSARALEKQVVFSSVDTERGVNAAFLEKHPVTALPTLFLLDPATDEVLVRWVGTLDVAQLKKLVEGARRSNVPQKLLAQGKDEAAAKAYLAQRERTLSGPELLSMLAALSGAKDYAACVQKAEEAWGRVTDEAERAGVAAWGLGCAVEQDGRDEAALRGRAAMVALAKEAVALPGAMEDDVSGLYELLVEERKGLGGVKAARAMALAWLDFLEGAAAKAGTPAARATYDAHRVSAAIAADVPERAVAALERSEADFPKDYNPPARLALLREAQGRRAEAAVVMDRALVRCTEGPRRLRLLEAKARLVDGAARVQVLEEALRWAEQLPAAQVPEARVAALARALAAAKGDADGGAR